MYSVWLDHYSSGTQFGAEFFSYPCKILKSQVLFPNKAPANDLLQNSVSETDGWGLKNYIPLLYSLWSEVTLINCVLLDVFGNKTKFKSFR